MYHGFETLRVDNEFGVRDIPYSKSEKSSDKRDYRPSVFIIPPMNGTMWEAKSVALRERFAQHDEGCVAFGYSDLNDTTARRVDFSIYRSIDDTRQMFERITEGPQIVVASSFGATAALKLAQQYPERVAGLVLIAPGVSINKQMLKKHLADEKRRLDYETKGFAEMHVFSYPNPENTGVSASKIKKYRVQKAELDKAAREEVIKPRKKIVLECPVLIIHDPKDKHIPFRGSKTLRKKIEIHLPGVDAPQAPRLSKADNAGFARHEFDAVRHYECLFAQIDRMIDVGGMRRPAPIAPKVAA